MVSRYQNHGMSRGLHAGKRAAFFNPVPLTVPKINLNNTLNLKINLAN